jgi:hypothetical protein
MLGYLSPAASTQQYCANVQIESLLNHMDSMFDSTPQIECGHNLRMPKVKQNASEKLRYCDYAHLYYPRIHHD